MLCFILSRASSNPRILTSAFHNQCRRALAFKWGGSSAKPDDDDIIDNNNNAGNKTGAGATKDDEIFIDETHHSARIDPLPSQLKEVVRSRVKHDVLIGVLLAVGAFGLYSTGVFWTLQPTITYIIALIACIIGVCIHYALPQLRRQTPGMLLATPVLKTAEFGVFESTNAATVMWFEVMYVWWQFIERNLVYPLLVLSVSSMFAVRNKDQWYTPLVIPVISVKLLRTAYCNASQLTPALLLALLIELFDFHLITVGSVDGVGTESATSTASAIGHTGPKRLWFADIIQFPVNLYFLVVVWPKVCECYDKLQFVLAYSAPWQISWGSAFHAFAQPFSIPHSAFTIAQTFISSLFSAPINPFLGSSFFITSYVRPVKFWEKDYNTRRVDNSNTRLITQIDRGPTTDDSNFNAIFYEHLTRSLQNSLAGDLAMGRWATSVAAGDCFILASFYLNCLVHIIEVGNGFVTFQLRGLEFRGQSA